MTHGERVDELLGELHTLFRALGEPLRLTVLRSLLRHPGGLTVTALTDMLGTPQSTLSRHLAVLRQAGVVTSEKAGTTRIYRVAIDPGTLAALDALTATIRACQDAESQGT